MVLLSAMAGDLDTSKAFLFALAAKRPVGTESALNHNMPLNNPFGVNTINSKGQAAGNRAYASVDAAVQHWESMFADRVRGAAPAEAFIQGLQNPVNGGPYNSATAGYAKIYLDVYNSVLKYMKLCGIV